MKTIYLTVGLFICSFLMLGQNGTCLQSEPLCLIDNVAIFPNCFNGNDQCVASGEAGPDYGCLGSTPFPNWQTLQIEESGDIELMIIQNQSFDANGEPSGTPLDVDFILWGPFTIDDDFCSPDSLNESNTVDCSFSAAAEETVEIPNTITGEIYVLLITNFNQSQGFIKVEQTGGEGTINCAPLAIDEVVFEEMKVYPNPTSDFITIESNVPEEKLTVKFFDILGKEIIISPVNRDVSTLQFELSSWKSGVYFVNMSVGNNVKTTTIIRN